MTTSRHQAGSFSRSGRHPTSTARGPDMKSGSPETQGGQPIADSSTGQPLKAG